MFMFSRSGKIIPVARNSTVKVKENALYGYTEQIKGHGGGKSRGGRKIYFSIFLHSLKKLLRSLTKPVEFGQTLPVYFTVCSGSYSSMHPQCNVSYSFILNFSSSIKKHSQSLVQGMVLGHSKTLNVKH